MPQGPFQYCTGGTERDGRASGDRARDGGEGNTRCIDPTAPDREAGRRRRATSVRFGSRGMRRIRRRIRRRSREETCVRSWYSAVMKVLTNGRVYRYDPEYRRYSLHYGAILDAGRIVSLDPGQAGAGIEEIDLNGATVLPAFADCHVHLTDTGYFLDERFLGGVRSYKAFADAICALPRGPVVFAGQYDESTWSDGRIADAAPLERAHPDALAMLVRVDGHSCIVNRRTFAWLALPPDTQGIDRDGAGNPTGRLLLDANWRAQSRFMEHLPLAARRDADRRATELALSRGYLHLHAQFVGLRREQYAEEIAALRHLPKAKWYPKICEPDPALAHELGLPYIGGDVFLDGSIGSCTAAVVEPYRGGESPANCAIATTRFMSISPTPSRLASRPACTRSGIARSSNAWRRGIVC